MSASVGPGPSPAANTGDDRTLARLVDSLPDAVIVVDGEGRLGWCNARAQAMLGISLAESLGMSGLDLVHPDDLEFVLRSLASVQDKEVGAPIEVRLDTTSGWRLMELVGTPVAWFGEGCVLVTLRDLTQRRQFELVHDHDSRLRSLIQNSAAITMLVSPDGCVESVSGALTRLLGQDPEVIEGQPLSVLVSEADRSVLAGAFDRASRGATVAGPVTVTVSLLRHGSRGTLPFELAIVNLIDDPTVGGYVVTGHDVTERKAAETELRNALWMLTATLDATADGILVVDNDDHIVSFNQRLTEMWDVPDSLLFTQDRSAVTEYVSGQLVDPESYVAKVEQVYDGGPSESHDTLEFKDGRVFDRVSKPQMVDGEVIGRVWSFRDVTDRKQLEQRLSYQAFHDSLTGLPNRALFADRLDHGVSRVDRNGGHLAVLFLDLDNLKVINDTLGHTAGDLVLQTMAGVIVGCLRDSDTAARLGGDEFGIVVEQFEDEADVIALAERLLVAIGRLTPIAGRQVSTTASIGITFHAPGLSGDRLLSNADLAMYAAKEEGGNRYWAFDDGMLAPALAKS